jgi:hypothetical protein
MDVAKTKAFSSETLSTARWLRTGFWIWIGFSINVLVELWLRSRAVNSQIERMAILPLHNQK